MWGIAGIIVVVFGSGHVAVVNDTVSLLFEYDDIRAISGVDFVPVTNELSTVTVLALELPLTAGIDLPY